MGSEVRAAALPVASSLLHAAPSRTSGPTWSLKLPMLLTARPGNVGVQIDSFRTLKMFHRPRCGKFTAQFQGVSFENHSMENHARMVERTHARARIVSERLHKLEEHEAKMVADERKRRQRRKEREAAQQRQLWLARQATKKDEQRQREELAARTIQRVARGHIARYRVRELKELKEEYERHRAACRLQASIKSFVRKKCTETRRQDREKERRQRAATLIQRQARKRRNSGNYQLLDALPADEARDSTAAEMTADSEVLVSSPESVVPPLELLDTIALPPNVENSDLSHELSLELLFSIPSPEVQTHASIGDDLIVPVRREPSRSSGPRRPVTIKRVGGGFRQSTFQSPRLRTSRPPELAQAITPTRPQPPPPQHHTARVPRGRVVARPPTTDTASNSTVGEEPVRTSSNEHDHDDGHDDDHGNVDPMASTVCVDSTCSGISDAAPEDADVNTLFLDS